MPRASTGFHCSARDRAWRATIGSDAVRGNESDDKPQFEPVARSGRCYSEAGVRAGNGSHTIPPVKLRPERVRQSHDVEPWLDRGESACRKESAVLSSPRGHHADFDAETVKRGSRQRNDRFDRKVCVVEWLVRHPHDHAAPQRDGFHRGIQQPKIRLTQRTQNQITRL